MIRRSTVVYILILLVLAGAYFYLKNRPKPTADVLVTPEATEQVRYLFTAEEGTPTSIRIQSNKGEAVELVREADQAWALTLPFAAKAEQGSAEAAATQVTTMRVLDKASSVDPGIVGLQQPEYVLSVKLNGSVERKINIGNATPSESGYYVQEASGGDISIVSKSSIDALLMLLTQPPYLETPTPSVTPTGTLPTTTPAAETPTPQP